MLSIGIRLSIEDFALAFKRYKILFPQEFLQFIYNYFLFLRDSGYTHQFAYLFICCRPLPLSVGFVTQYIIKPILGVLIAKAFGIPQIFYAGFVLTACVSGAQLSSYASFLSKGDVAVSILLSSSTTIASVLITPLLTGLLIGSVIPVDAVAMSKSILQVMSALGGQKDMLELVLPF